MSEQVTPENADEHPVNEGPCQEVKGQASSNAPSQQKPTEAVAPYREANADEQTPELIAARDRMIEESRQINRTLSLLVVLLVLTLAGELYYVIHLHNQMTVLDRARRVAERRLYAPLSYYDFPSHTSGQPGNAVQAPAINPWLMTEQDLDFPQSVADLNRLQDEMIQVVNQPFGINPHVRNQNFAFSPGLALQDHKDHYTVTMNVHGIKPSAVKVRVENQTLTVSGNNDQTVARKDDKGQVVLNEQETGSFETALRLPGPVQADKMKTEFRHNQLSVTLPKAAPSAGIISGSTSAGREA